MALGTAHTIKAQQSYLIQSTLIQNQSHSRAIIILQNLPDRNPNRNPNPNVTWSELPPESNDFFHGPYAAFTPNFVKFS